MIKRSQIPSFWAPYCIAFEKSVGAIVFRVVDNKTEFLVIKYRNGHWEFPRGKVEDHESEYDTMMREIKEETKLTDLATIGDFREIIRFSYKAHGYELEERKKDKNCIFVHKKAVFYLAQAFNTDVVISHEHQQFKWLAFNEALNVLTFKNAKNVLIQAQKKLKQEL